eukprot:6203622-Pleurochrysis_carterae.AAC.3
MSCECRFCISSGARHVARALLLPRAPHGGLRDLAAGRPTARDAAGDAAGDVHRFASLKYAHACTD